MTPHLVLVRNGMVAAEIAVDRPVCRIGSDPKCALRLEGIEPHAATLQCRGQACYVFNRTARVLRLGDVGIGPGQSAPWPEGQTLVFGDQAEVRLRGGPAAAQIARPDGVPAASSSPESRTRRRAILSAALLAATALAVYSSMPSTDVDARLRRLVETIHTSSSCDARLRIACQLVQQGRSQEMRKDLEQAVERYGQVRDLLLAIPAAGREPPSGQRARIEGELIAFVRDQLLRLAKR